MTQARDEKQVKRNARPRPDIAAPVEVESIVLRVDVDARGVRWTCDDGVPALIKAGVALLDKALVLFCSWRAGDYFRMEAGDVRVLLKWTANKPVTPFDATGFAAFAGRVESYAMVRAIHKASPTSRTEAKLGELTEGFGKEVLPGIDQLVDALIERKRPLVVSVGPEEAPVRFSAGQLPPQDEATPSVRVNIAARTDGVMVTTERGERIFIADPTILARIKAGDRVEFIDLQAARVMRCIRAKSATVVVESTQYEMID
jgi:hypothetical protein